jgi:hypothetical protein
VPQIPELAERGMARGQRFFTTLDERLREVPWLAGDGFSFADITAFVFVEFAAWVKMVPDELERWRLARGVRGAAERAGLGRETPAKPRTDRGAEAFIRVKRQVLNKVPDLRFARPGRFSRLNLTTSSPPRRRGPRLIKRGAW